MSLLQEMEKFGLADCEFNRKLIKEGFHEYVKSFYGQGGIYDFNFTDEEIQNGIRLRLSSRKDIEFCGDTFDREMTRDIILNLREVE